MSKLSIFFWVSMLLGCTSSSGNNEAGISDAVNQGDSKVSGYKVKSKVVPYYLPDNLYGYKSDEYTFLEQLDSLGVPQMLQVYNNEDEELLKVTFSYNSSRQLSKITEIIEKEKDTSVHIVDHKNNTAVSRRISSGLTFLIDGFVFNKSNQIIERFQLENNPPSYYLVNEFDESGRIISSVRLIDGGLDTYVYYEKYKYPDNKLVWDKREVLSMEKVFDSEDIGLKKLDLKTQVLPFPGDIEKSGEKVTETREINLIR